MSPSTADRIALPIALAACYGAAGVGALAGAGADGWYADLAKPAWTPPSWVFGPVWTALYAMMGVAAWLVWRERRRRPVAAALAFFAAQLLLNAAWTPLFFGLHRPDLALLDIGALAVTLAVTVVLFARVRAAAAWLLAPYLLWILFAAALNAAIWRLNP